MAQPVYSRSHPGKYVLVLDTETTGSTFGTYEETFSKYQAIAFAAIVATSDTFEPVEDIYFKIKFNFKKYQWSAEAEKIHGITREQLEAEGIEEEEGAADLAEFIFKHFGTGKVAMLGHNVNFDIAAMGQLLKPHGVMPEIHHVVIDSSPMAFAMIGEYKSDKVFAFFEGEERPTQHNALDDAYMALNAVKTMKALVQASLSST